MHHPNRAMRRRAVNAIGQLAFVPAYPVWGLAMFAVDILIIYALAVHAGGRLRTA